MVFASLLQFKQTPRLFWEQISALNAKALVVVDEVQRVPALLDYVQKGIEEKQMILDAISKYVLSCNGEEVDAFIKEIIKWTVWHFQTD